MFENGQQVHHPQFGTGSVLLDQGQTVVVRFGERIESCEASALGSRLSLADAVRVRRWSSPLDVTLKAQAAAIRSLNDAWGVFSRSHIDLLPHQLWVCYRALQRWPLRMLIADDVGLGKTIEAGLILSALLASDKVRRVLILTPAGLVEQWQYRLKSLFDIRCSLYRPEVDRPRADFWSVHNQVVASLPTMRLDRGGRHERLLEAESWDLLIVDEAHHLNADQDTGTTLGFRLVEQLLNQGRVTSCLFFTGTPHRGKPFGFWSLMSLLDPDRFSPRRPDHEQLPHLRDYLIRNFKPKVTDMRGQPLFQPITNRPETYSYSQAETDFYAKLTDFIVAGNAYASSLDRSGAQQVNLVLIAMQKIASSSVAAIRSALRKRVSTIEVEIRNHQSQQQDSADAFEDEDQDLLAAWERWTREARFKLFSEELPNLQELLAAAETIGDESKITRIAELIAEQFPDRAILLFTEYKATQALMVSTLMARFGEDAVGFINGDDRLPGVTLPSGRETQLSRRREDTADAFNAGRLRFLVSTEAGGEGIDLQARCHTLIHVDLPWNPMRLHQRVGRLNRYGQTYPVEVITVRNPATVESRIWNKLEHKLTHIMRALGHAMDEPEDMLQMVLGMARPELFNQIFAEGQQVRQDRFDDWFDAKTRSLGGQSALNTVMDLVGHCQSFDLSQLEDVPKKDLPDLIAFFHGALIRNKRRPEQDSGVFSFKTPEAWLNSPGVRTRYEGLTFSRQAATAEQAKRIIGVGHQVFDEALAQALEREASLAPLREIEQPLAILTVLDAVTGGQSQVRQVIVGVTQTANGDFQILKDDEVLDILNRRKPGSADADDQPTEIASATITAWIDQARETAKKEVKALLLPFKHPIIGDFALFWPGNTKG
ncbi:RNA polymerase-associated protein RapA [Thiorhodovibrio winogradskyi]|uniref:RNA polymerase-associated protein RapA n=1 Tax=Thiorhodovibrio winogradskyi TaxID=77007 RepID=A0ABZ0SD25_9GAMM|nr:DEAD/DEAH box helicase [Thiorhodovibrio winogradskyi]